MAQPSIFDLTKGIDLTTKKTVSGSQLNQLVDVATPYTDKGLVVTTLDVAAVPEVPDAITVPKWTKYLWRRIMAASVVIYVWNENGATDATFLKWTPITIASIPDGSITTVKLANFAVTDDKVTSVHWNKITGKPDWYNMGSNAAGGDLVGTYPNPTIGINKVDSIKLLSDNANDALRAVTTNHIKDLAVIPAKLGLTGSAALAILRANAGNTAVEFSPAPLTHLTVLGTAFQVPQVNAAGTAVEWANSGGGRILKREHTLSQDADFTNLDIQAVNINTLPTTAEGKEFTQLNTNFTPLSASSELIIEVGMMMSPNNGAPVAFALFMDAVCLAATVKSIPATNYDVLTMKFAMVSPGIAVHDFRVRFGILFAGAATVYINRTSAGNGLFGGVLVPAYMTITEYAA